MNWCHHIPGWVVAVVCLSPLTLLFGYSFLAMALGWTDTNGYEFHYYLGKPIRKDGTRRKPFLTDI